MKDEEIEGLLDEASGLYNDGCYDDAIAIWKRILGEHPDHERALEGIKMAQLLTSDWERAAVPSPDAAPDPDADLAPRIQEGIRRVNDLLAAGDLDSAREGVEALTSVAPQDPAVAALAAKVQAAANPQGYVEEQLALARHYAMQGETEEAAEACRRVLAIDPANVTAAEILDGPTAGSDELDLALDGAVPPSGEQPAAEADAIPLDLSDAAGGMSVEAIDAGALELNEPVAAEEPPAAEGTEGKIAALLAEGDQLLAQGKFEDAIDSWSRIFILQDDNADAERRIDEARQHLERRARKMEEHLGRGEDLISKGLLQDARLEFEAVLRIRPQHAEAMSRIEFLDRQTGAAASAVPGPGASPAPEAPPALSRPPDAPRPPAPRDDIGAGMADQEESRLPTPPPAPPKRPTETRPAPKKIGGPVIAVVVVVFLGAAAAGTYLAWQKFFPPPATPPAGESREGPAAPTPTPAEEAPAGEAVQGDEGPGSLEIETEPAAVEPAAAAHPSASVADRKKEASAARTEGIARFRAGEFEVAVERLKTALELDPTNFETQDWLTKAEDELKTVQAFDRELAAVQAGFDDKDYRAALYKLYRIEAPDERAKAKVDRWIRICWYDWGVTLLKAGNARESEEKFREVLDLAPSDRQASQNLDVATRYQQRPIDQAYETYAERLDLRPLD